MINDGLDDAGTRGPWMATWSGNRFYPLTPRAGEMHFEDIAHHLARICRFGGAVARFYSVAEHCTIGSSMPAAGIATLNRTGC